jgi:signal transduction histidine kinase
VALRETGEGVEVTVSDDGAGFEGAAAWQQAAAGASLGLMSMRERVLLAGGTFDVQSAPGQGTTIRARL